MSNKDLQSAWAYHEATKLSYINLSTKPPIYKSYPGLPLVDLPKDFDPPPMSTLEAVSATASEGGPPVNIDMIARLLFFSAGLVRKSVFPMAGEVHFRAAASAGGLYPIEVYLVCKDIPGLDAGAYHFSPLDFALCQLRKGDYRGELSSAAGDDSGIAASPVTLIFSPIFWRSAWKYRARSYRYCFWDGGTIAANMLATASASGLPARVVMGFVDDKVNRLLGLQGEREASICLFPIGHEEAQEPLIKPSSVTPLSVDEVTVTNMELEYPEITQLHRDSSLGSNEEVMAWRGVLPHQIAPKQPVVHDIVPLEEQREGSIGLGKVILERGSTRRFDRKAISRAQFGNILHASTGGVPADFLGPQGMSLLDLYVIVNEVDGVPPGAYFYSSGDKGLEFLREGLFRSEAGHLAFEQALGADASVVAFVMADLQKVMGRFGNRGYRAAQFEAGIMGGRIYLCANSVGVGATGLTFYDDEVVEFFEPHSHGKSAIFVVAIGNTGKPNRVRPFRSRVGVRLDALSRGATRGHG